VTESRVFTQPAPEAVVRQGRWYYASLFVDAGLSRQLAMMQTQSRYLALSVMAG
jgi:hypothetical protein